MGLPIEQKREYQKEWLKQKRCKAIALLGGLCVVCGATEKLEFDHINPLSKSFAINNHWSYRWSTLLPELNKCQLLCEGCHLKKTSLEMQTTEHGVSMYARGCRCPICREGGTQGKRNWRAKQKLLHRDVD